MKRVLIWIFTSVVIVASLAVGVVAVNSSKTTPAFLDDQGQVLANSISEIRDVSLNGVQQRILIRGRDKSKPLLLHLHGGPGGADQAIIQSTGKTLEDLFTVVYWDQRGTGASYDKAAPADSLTIRQITDDGIELTQQLLSEFGHDKLFLQGHSWGTLLGVHMVTQAPELFHAYLAIGQFAHAQRAEKLSWDFAVSAAEAAGDMATLNKLQALGSPPYSTDREWVDNVMQQRALMIPYENPNSPPAFTMTQFHKIFALYNGYDLSEKLGMLEAPNISMEQLWPSVVASNLIESHAKLDVPYFVLQGKHDQHTVTYVAKQYFEAVDAPIKRYYTFDKSAHWPHITEYQKYREHVKGIIAEVQ